MPRSHLVANTMTRYLEAKSTPEDLKKRLFEVANTLYDVRASVRAITTDGLNDAYEGYTAGFGPIPQGHSQAQGILKVLRNKSQAWDAALGRFAGMLEWLGKDLMKPVKTAAAEVKRIQFRTRPLAEGVTTQDFSQALLDGVQVLLSNIKDAKALVKALQAEVKPEGLLHSKGLQKVAELCVSESAVWEQETKALAQGFKDLVKALNTTRKASMFDGALAKLASMNPRQASEVDDLEKGLQYDEKFLSKLQASIRKLKAGEAVENLTLANALSAEKGLKQAIENKKKLIATFKGKTAAMTERSKFEEGKPADPTKNMSPEDAAEWKRQNEQNKDNFKAARGSR